MLNRMQVRETTLKELIQGEKQFRTPLWQRQYTWKRLEHEQLWRDILEQYSALGEEGAATTASGHFLGSFVLSPVATAASGVASYLIVDGQQRLTTLLLILCAIRDAVSVRDPQAVEKYNELYLVNKFQEGHGYYRLSPTQEDRPAFQACVQGSSGAGGVDGVGAAYRFFRSQLELSDLDGEALDLDRLTNVVVERLAIVDITTSAGDNAHRIFQSLNGTGVGLTQADLIRNYMFMLLPTRGEVVYDELWRPMEELIGFENLEALARLVLQREGIEVTKDDVYRQHQARLDGIAGNEAAVEAEVKTFSVAARHYKRLLDPSSEADEALRASLIWLSRWGAQTSYPVLMLGFDLEDKGLIDHDELRLAASYIESFVVRRQLAGFATNSLSRLFVQIAEQLPRGPGFAARLREELSRERRSWPSDQALREAIRTRSFYYNGRPHQRTMILERLERSFDHPEPVDFDAADLTIEHILPQTLSDDWREHLQSLGQDPDEVRDEFVHTLGNLTLTAFNGTLSNNPFDRKKEIYDASHLELNRALAENDAWGRDEILARAERLSDQVIMAWPGPIAGVSDTPLGFDWSRVNAAVAAIPAGRWTTYGDLAQLGGTAPLPVGQHLAGPQSPANAYRVLTAQGYLSADFHWADPADTTDVRVLLETEGVTFDSDGRASEAQRISAKELLTLIETPDRDELDAPDSASTLSSV
jgi:alkylated DNA nucleotide flippase Atl1